MGSPVSPQTQRTFGQCESCETRVGDLAPRFLAVLRPSPPFAQSHWKKSPASLTVPQKREARSPRGARGGRGGAGFGGRRELGAHVPAGGWASATRGRLHRVILGLRATRGLLGAWSLVTQAEGCHLLGAGPVGRAGSDRPGCRWAIPSRALSCP